MLFVLLCVYGWLELGTWRLSKLFRKKELKRGLSFEGFGRLLVSAAGLRVWEFEYLLVAVDAFNLDEGLYEQPTEKSGT